MQRSTTPATQTRGALQLQGFDWPLARMQAELDAVDPRYWRPLGQGTGWSQIQLLEPDGRGGEVQHPVMASCPAMHALAESFGARVMAMTLARLEPGGGVHEHRDISGGVSMGVLRLHVPLRTDPGVEFVVDGVRVSMREGETWHLDTTYPHRVANHSQINRVHLIIDLEATPQLRELLPKPDLKDYLHRAEFGLIVVGKGLERAATNPKQLVEMATKFVRLRVLGQSVLTFNDERTDLAEPSALADLAERKGPEVPAKPKSVPEVFACPECRASELELVDDLRAREGVAWAGSFGLRCKACKREYPHVNGVWVLWSDELATLIAAGELDTESIDVGAPDQRTVKQANFAVYQQVSEAYGEHADASVDYVDQLLLLKAHARELVEQDASGDALGARERVLVDVGCASGFSLDVGSAGFATRVGVDISLANLEQVAARGHIAVLADAERLPFADAAVDLVTCFAAMHHFPDHTAFLRSVGACLRPGGVLLTSADPSERNMHMGLFARAAWDLRKPVYRQLSRVSDRFYLHVDERTQALNDLAEHHRTGGGFEPSELRTSLRAAGLGEIEIFFGADRRGRQRWGIPSWQEAVLKGLSGRNPLARKNFVSLTTLSRKLRE
jgi:SAM-dependent methyltransferase/uncharacterized protein YbaR (Trm112 family)